MKLNLQKLGLDKIARSLMFLATVLLFSVACSDDETPSLWVEKPKGDTPVISSLEPADKGLAGVTIVTINGENFLEDASLNYVYFNAGKAEILESSPTKLVVKAPNVISDSVIVKVGVHGAELFSNNYNFKLEPAVSEVYDFADFEQPYAITSDPDGNIYLSLVSTNVGQGVKKLTPDGELLDYAPKGGETFYSGLKYGADGNLYGVRAVRAIFLVTEGAPPATYAVLDNGTAMLDLDFDKNLNIWTGGTGGKIYSVTPDKEVTSFEFEPKVNSLRVFNDHLYVSGIDTDDKSKIWKFAINSSSDLGAAEEVFDLSATFPEELGRLTAITLSEAGDIFVGTDGSMAMIKVTADGSASEWYPGLLEGPVLNFAWSTGVDLFYSRASSDNFPQTILKVNMERNGAPHFGRD